jgi:hypothetical protein
VLLRWATSPPVFTARWPRYAAVGISVLSLIALLIQIPLGIGVALVLGGPLALFTRALVSGVLQRIDEPRRELGVLAHALERLEEEEFRCAALKTRRAWLVGEKGAASRHIARLHRLATWHEARNNQLFAPIALLFFWDIHFAYAFESWRARHGASVERWLCAVGELEALCALAAYAFEHPEDPFPEVAEDGAGGVFDGIAVGHPLLPGGACVRNDVRLDSEGRLLVVSGSNMSGKSTLLRTVGINTVLALAGAPVRAGALRVSVVAIGATLRIQDSIREGSSRFYAEINRLRQLMDLAKGARPLLFLLDELLAGTNSHERRTGAEGILQGLIEAGAIGLVTTHDLALADIATALVPRAANVHFEDRLEGGRLSFDYRLRPGVVTKSNALELMRTVGLQV